MTFEIRQIPVPEDAAAAPSWLVHGAARVSALSEIDERGYADLAETAAEIVASYAAQQHTRKVRFVAVVADDGDPASVLGVANVGFPLRDNPHLAGAHLTVRPDVRGRGIGAALWRKVRAGVEEAGRTVVMSFTDHGAEPEVGESGVLVPATGSGRVPGRAASARFASSLGFSLEQVERHSLLRVPAAEDLVAAKLAAAAEAAETDYELIRWTDCAPDELVPGLCALQVAMSTDAPTGELAMEAETWDEDRLRAAEQVSRAAGRRAYLVAAVHRQTGEVAGYTEVQVLTDRPEVGYQENTIVLRAHRGHRLGMWLKAANLQQLAVESPELRRIHTWNAEENGHMLAINEALGFAPAGVEGAWQLKLSE